MANSTKTQQESAAQKAPQRVAVPRPQIDDSDTPRPASTRKTVPAKPRQPAPNAQQEAPATPENPGFEIKFAHSKPPETPLEYPLQAQTLQEAKAEAFRMLSSMPEDIDHLEIHQHGKLICRCDFDYETGKWGDWSKPRRDVTEASWTPAQNAQWKADEQKFRAADEARKAGIKPGKAESKTEPARVPRMAFSSKVASQKPTADGEIIPLRVINSQPTPRQEAFAKSLAAASSQVPETAKSGPQPVPAVAAARPAGIQKNGAEITHVDLAGEAKKLGGADAIRMQQEQYMQRRALEAQQQQTQTQAQQRHGQR